MGIDYQGSEWILEATNMTGAQGSKWVVGKVFLEDSHIGVTRFGAFHEHIGCTPCNSFYESEIRVGPYAIKSADSPKWNTTRSVQSIHFARKNASCDLYDVKVGAKYGVPSAQFFTGPGTGP